MLQAKQSEFGIEEEVHILCGKIAEETRRCRELLELTRAEQEFLMKNDIENLSRNTDSMKKAIGVLKRSQLERRELMEAIGCKIGVGPEKLSIKRIEKEINSELAHRLEEISKDLVKTGERLFRLNHNTIYLIDFSLDLLDQQSRLWAQLISEEEGYQEEGQRVQGTTGPVFVEEKV